MDGEDEGEEEEIEHDVAAYRAAVKRWTDFALSKGIEPISVGFGESE
ncbi:MAG: hypothetical protein M5R36_19860 [Deltaproteobacteria bacterium]|nr:hypothetical protein [Deltaproteobacteria bacterium]